MPNWHSDDIRFALGCALIDGTDYRRRVLNSHFKQNLVNRGSSHSAKAKMRSAPAVMVFQKIRENGWDRPIYSALHKSQQQLFEALDALLDIFEVLVIVCERSTLNPSLKERLLQFLKSPGQKDQSGDENESPNGGQLSRNQPAVPISTPSIARTPKFGEKDRAHNRLADQYAVMPGQSRHVDVAHSLPPTPVFTTPAVTTLTTKPTLVRSTGSAPLANFVTTPTKNDLHSVSVRILKMCNSVACQTVTPSKKPSPAVKRYRETMCQTDEAPQEQAKRYHEVGAQTVQTASASQTHVFEWQRESPVDTQDSGQSNRHSENRKRNLDTPEVEITISAPKCARVAVVLNRNYEH